MSNAHFIRPSFPTSAEYSRELPSIPESEGFSRSGSSTIVLTQPMMLMGTGSSAAGYQAARSVKLPVASIENSFIDIEFLTYTLTPITQNVLHSIFIAMWRDGERFFELDMKGQISANRTLWYRHLFLTDSDIIRRASIPGVPGNASATAAWIDYAVQMSGFDEVEFVLKLAAEPGVGVMQDWFKLTIY